MKKKAKKRGRKSGRLIIDGNWQEAVKKAVKREKPPEGWPKDSK
jgi:hypothetical protein